MKPPLQVVAVPAVKVDRHSRFANAHRLIGPQRLALSEEEDGADDEERGQDNSKQKGRLSGWRQVVGVERPLSGSEEEDEFGYVSPFGTRQPARFLRKAPQVEPQQATLAAKQATSDKKRGAVDLSAMSASVGMGW